MKTIDKILSMTTETFDKKYVVSYLMKQEEIGKIRNKPKVYRKLYHITRNVDCLLSDKIDLYVNDYLTTIIVHTVRNNTMYQYIYDKDVWTKNGKPIKSRNILRSINNFSK